MLLLGGGSTDGPKDDVPALAQQLTLMQHEQEAIAARVDGPESFAQAAAASIRNAEKGISAELGGRLQVLERISALARQKDEKITQWTSDHQIGVADHTRLLEKLQHQVEGLCGRMRAVEAAQVACQQGAMQAEPVVAQSTAAPLTRDLALHACQTQQGEQITALRLRVEEQHEELVGLHTQFNAAKELASLHERSPSHDEDLAKPTSVLGSNDGLPAPVQEVQRKQEQLACVQREQQQEITSLRIAAQAAAAPHELIALQREQETMMDQMHELQGEVAYLLLATVSHDSKTTLPSLAKDLAAVQREQEATAGRIQSLVDAASQAATAGIRKAEEKLSKELALGLQELARALGANTPLPTKDQKQPMTAALSRPVEHLMPVCSRRSSSPGTLTHGLSADPKDCDKRGTAAQRPVRGSPHGGRGQGTKSPTQQQDRNAKKSSLAAAMLANSTERLGSPERPDRNILQSLNDRSHVKALEGGFPSEQPMRQAPTVQVPRAGSTAAASANPQTALMQKSLGEADCGVGNAAAARAVFNAAVKHGEATPVGTSSVCSNELIKDVQGNLDSLVSSLTRSLGAGSDGFCSPAHSA